MENFEKTSKHWGVEDERNVGNGIHWTEIEKVQKRINFKISGDTEIGWMQYVREKYFNNIEKLNCLSICCGKGILERQMMQSGFCTNCLGIDVSKDCISHARKKAIEYEMDISYEVADINQISLPENKYDIVVSASALHHIEKLEYVLKQINISLKDNGIFIVIDYVGENHLQFRRIKKNIISEIYDIIPLELKKVKAIEESIIHSNENSLIKNENFLLKNIYSKYPLVYDFHKMLKPIYQNLYFFNYIINRIKSFIIRDFIYTDKNKLGLDYKISIDFPSKEEIIDCDPTEAIRSEEILPIIKEKFHIEEIKFIGGSILQLLLYRIAFNFESNNFLGDRVLDLLFDIEDRMVEKEILTSDYVFLLAKKNG